MHPPMHALDVKGKRSGSTVLRRITCALMAVALMSAFVMPMPQAEAAQDGLSIYVGYAGGPFYEKVHFTDAELRGMSDGVIYEYSALDTALYLRKGFAKGVNLDTILRAADIEAEAMWRFYLCTGDGYVADNDSYGTNGEAWYYSNLVGMNRFYYPAIPRNSEFVANKFNGIYQEGYNAVLESAVVVPTMIAFESAFSRIGSADSSEWDYQPISANSGYRLMFGQTAPTEITARNSAMNITGITCILGGYTGKDIPKIEMGDVIKALENAHVGNSFMFTPGLSNVMDQTILDQGIKDIVMETDNPDVLGLVQNADGSWTITVLKAGTANLKVHFGNSSDSDFVAAYMGTAAMGSGGGDSGGEGGGGDGGDDGAGGGDDGAGKGDGDTTNDVESSDSDDPDPKDNESEDIGEDDSDAVNDVEDSDSDDPDPKADEERIVTFDASTPLQHVSMKPAASMSAEAGAEDALSGEDSASGGYVELYELVFDEEPEDPEDDPPDLSAVLATVLGLLGFGGLRKVGSFELSKDRSA